MLDVGLLGHLVGGQGVQSLCQHQFTGGCNDALHRAQGAGLGGLFFQGAEREILSVHKTKY